MTHQVYSNFITLAIKSTTEQSIIHTKYTIHVLEDAEHLYKASVRHSYLHYERFIGRFEFNNQTFLKTSQKCQMKLVHCGMVVMSVRLGGRCAHYPYEERISGLLSRCHRERISPVDFCTRFCILNLF